MHTTAKRLVSALALAGLFACATPPTAPVEDPGTHAWTVQFGTGASDVGHDVATDANAHSYTTGSTHGALEGSSAGGVDAYVRSHDQDGALRWTRQFGTAETDVARGVTTDGNGNVYVGGYTGGALEGANAGSSDAFVRSYDGAGALRWTRQFGTGLSDSANAIAVDGTGNVYAAGGTNGALEGSNAGGTDVFVRSLDAAGALRWTRQFGTAGTDWAYAVATDASGNVYVAGYTTAILEGVSAGGWDAYVRSYDGDGTLRWTSQFGTDGLDIAFGVAVDGNGHVYLTGYTGGALEGGNAGGRDGFVRSYDGAGGLRWTRQFGTSGYDEVYGIASDANGSLYITGYTEGVIEGANAGADDAFVRAYDSEGTVQWTRQFGTSSAEEATGIAIDPDGYLYVTGHTGGALIGASEGGTDAFVRKYRR